MVKNPIAKAVRTPRFKIQVVKPKKGRGSYSRLAKSIDDMRNGRYSIHLPSDRA